MSELLVPAGFGTDARSVRVSAMMRDKNNMSRRPLTPYERKNLDEGENNPFYIYNVSPVHEWARPQGQLGVIFIPKRPWKALVSAPHIIKGAIVRWVPKGLTIEPFIEGGREIVEDICGCGQTADGRHPSSNLTRFGVFFTEKPFEADDLPAPKRAQLGKANKTDAATLMAEYLIPKHDQKKLLDDANGKLLIALQDRILEADNWANSQQTRLYIGEIHRDSLLALNTLTGRKETRPWAGVMTGETLQACDFCGNMNKPGLAKCPNCKEILNVEAYNKLKAAVGA